MGRGEVSAPCVSGRRLGCSGAEQGLAASPDRARQEQSSLGEGANGGMLPPDSTAAPLVLGFGQGWPGSVSASGLCSRDGQEVAVVYYREGYVPSNYDEQVSADPSAPKSHPCSGLVSECEVPCDPRGMCAVREGWG